MSSPIVFGRFETVSAAEDAARALYAHGFSVWDVSIISAAGPEARHAGVHPRVVLAACVRRANAGVAANVLREAGVLDVDRTQGTWDSGRWTDFDPALHGRRSEAVARESVDCESTGNEDPGSELEQYVNQQRASHD